MGSTVAAFLAGAVVALGGVAADSSGGASPSTALVIDASAGRDGRELVGARLRDADAEVRLAGTAAEASTDVRYFEAQGYRLVVAGPLATAAAAEVGARAVRAGDLDGALAALRR